MKNGAPSVSFSSGCFGCYRAFRGLAVAIVCRRTGTVPITGSYSIPAPNLNAPAATQMPRMCASRRRSRAIRLPIFDDYSWRTFIALVWPALNGQRGMPDPSQPLTATGANLVFETYKADWETFQPNGATPSAFNSVESYWTSNPAQSPCPQAKAGDFLLAPISKFGNVGLAGVGDLVSVLIAQNGTFVRYLAAYNQTEFNQIAAQKLYLAANLPQNRNPTGPSIVFQNGSIGHQVGLDRHDERSQSEPLSHAAGLACQSVVGSVQPVSGHRGLVGLHIVQKTPLASAVDLVDLRADRQCATGRLRAAATASAAEQDLHLQRRYRDAHAERHSAETLCGRMQKTPRRRPRRSTSSG